MSRGALPGPPDPRALLYLGYARLLGFPDAPLRDCIQSGDVAVEVAAVHRAARLAPPGNDLLRDVRGGLEPDYIAAFEVGVPEPPVPLYESAYQADDKASRLSVLEDLVRFYEFFDLDLGEAPSEAPDHLTVELEFMAALAQMEALAAGEGADRAPFRLAQRDFLDRHLLGFLRRICARALPDGFYAGALHALRRAVEQDRAALTPEVEDGEVPADA